MSALVPFAYGDALVRVVEVNDAPWWVAADVAKVLGYSHTPSMIRVLDDDEKGVRIVHTLGGDQEMTIISESGLYHAIIKSRRPEAKPFRKWVTSEVLPSLRRDGFYRMPGAQIAPEVPPPTPDAWAMLDQRLSYIERLCSALPMLEGPDFARAVTYAPSVFRYTNEQGKVRRHRQAKWFFDIPVREAVIALHRKMTISAAVAVLVEQFGVERAPTRSSLGRFWKNSIDPVVGIIVPPQPARVDGK